MKESRRQFLKTSAGLVGTGAVTAMAGCSQVPVIGGGGSGGNDFYRNWMYEPGEVVDDKEHYRFRALQPSAIAENEDSFDDDGYDALESQVERQFEATDVDFEDIDRYTALDSRRVTIAEGSFTAEDVQDELEDEEFEEETETDSGHTVYLNGSRGVAFGVSEGTIVRASSAPSDDADGEGEIESGPRPDMPVAADLRSIGYGEVVRGRLDEGDPESTDYYGNYEPVTFSGGAGDEIEITMRSEDDPRLMLVDPDGSVVAENDDDYDVEGTYNSQLTHTLDSSGEYTIVATSYSRSATFEYTLELRLLYSPVELVDAVETAIGTQSDETDRYDDEVDPASTLFDGLGGGDIVHGRTLEAAEDDAPEGGRFDHMVGRGTAISIDGDTSELRTVVVYEEADDFDEGNIEDWTEEGSQFDDVDDIDISQNENTAVITGTIDTDDLSG